MTALTLFDTATVSITLPTASQLSITHGTDNVNVTQTYTAMGIATGISELYSQGTTLPWQALASLPAPSGHGFYLEPSVLSLAGQQLLAGSYSATIRLTIAHTNGVIANTIVGDIHRRLWKVAGSTYTLILDMVATAQTIPASSGAITTYTLSGSTTAATNFGIGETLYIDEFVNVTTNGVGDPLQNIRINRLSTNMTGDTNAQMVTPGYQPAPTAYSAAVLALTPAVYYRMDETSGTTAHDISGFSHDGTLSGTVTLAQPGAIAGDPDTSMLFDGASGFLTVSAGYVTAGSAFSLVLWVKLTANNFSGYPCLAANDFPDSTHNGVSLILAPSTDGATGYAQLGNGVTATNMAFGSGVLPANVWTQFALTYDGANVRMYTNGLGPTHAALVGTLGTPASQMSIARYPGDSGYVPGYLDEVAFFASVLTPAQIASLYQVGQGSGLQSRQARIHFGRRQ